MDYIYSYIARTKAMGDTPKERELNASIREFQKYLSEHPSVELVSLGKQLVKISILSNKQDNSKITKQILSALDVPISSGTILRWKDANWIVFKQEKNPNEAYHSSYMVQCNSTLKWIDNFGILFTSPCYVKGNMENIIKENFRSWENIIVPQSNQALSCIVPTQDIKIDQKFIIDERSWNVVDYDKSSSDGIMYLSLVESKIDAIDDDITQQIANIDNLGIYRIELPVNKIECDINETYSITPLVYKNNILQSDQVRCYIPKNTFGANYTNEGQIFNIKATGHGAINIKFYLASNENVAITIPFECKTNPIQLVSYSLIGDSSIKVGRSAIYTMVKTDMQSNKLDIVSFTLNNTLATGTIQNGSIIITANDSNKIGDILLTATDGEQFLTKTIKIVPLW